MIIKKRPFKINWSGNDIYYQLFSEASLLDKTVVCEARLLFKRMDAANYVELLVLPLIPDNEGYVSVNWQTVLHSELEFFVPVLNEGLSYAQFTAKQTGQFYMEFREISDNNPDSAWSAEESESIRYVVKGGIPDFEFNNNAFWASYYPKNKPFLTWQLQRRLTGADEFIFLAWLHPFDLQLTTFSVDIKVYYNDQTDSIKKIFFSSNPGNVQYIPVGVTMLDLSSLQAGKKIWFWTVQVFSGTTQTEWTIASEVYSYEMDNRTDYNQVQLLYRASMGGLDSVRIRGVIEQKLDFDTQESSQPKTFYPQPNYLPATQYTLPATEKLAFKGDLGYLRKEEQDRQRDMLLNREMYQVNKLRLLPINFTLKTLDLTNSANMLWPLPIEWTMAHEGNKYYAPGNIDYGQGESSTCECHIKESGYNRSFENNDEICILTWAIIVVCDDFSHEYRMQYKIVGLTDWIEIAYTDSTYPQTTHAAGLAQVVVLWRVVCPNDGIGSIYVASANTIKEPGSGIHNSRITNTAVASGLPLSANIALWKNSIQIPLESIPPGEYRTFYVADAVGAEIKLSRRIFNFGYVQIKSNGVTYDPTSVTTSIIGGTTYIFASVDIVNGMQISFK